MSLLPIEKARNSELEARPARGGRRTRKSRSGALLLPGPDALLHPGAIEALLLAARPLQGEEGRA